MTAYALITPDGELSFASGDWRAPIGPEGSNQVRMDPHYGATGWVNDCGLLFPERYPRNMLGSIVLICMGANPQPYAGPVVITGWHPVTEVGDLPREMNLALPELARDVALVLDGDVEAMRGLDAGWCVAVTDAAAHVRSAPVAPIRLIPMEERS